MTKPRIDPYKNKRETNTYSLVDGDHGGLGHQVGHDTEGLDIVESRGGIETTGGAIPHVDGGAGGHLLGNRETLALSSGDTADEGVTDDGLDLLGQAVHLGKDVQELVNELLLVGLLGKTFAGGLGLQSGGQSLTNSQGRVMEIICVRGKR